MNLFVFWKNEKGEDELITPPLDGTILPGITRASILELAGDLKEFKITEGAFKIQEVVKAVDEGRLYEMFGSGTAAVLSPVSQFTFNETVYPVPIDERIGAGKLTQRMLKMLTDIQSGITEKPEWQFLV